MEFYIQKLPENDETLFDEIEYIKRLLNKPYNKIHSLKELTLEELKNLKETNSEAVPVGSLQFVGQYLKQIGLNEHMKPIEIPSFLRTKEFLNRKYKIVDFEELKNLKGKHFIKNITKLKSFTGIVNFDIQSIEETDLVKVENYKEHKYSVQEIKEFNAEYRILVTDAEVIGVQYYNGNNPLLFPDIKFVKDIVSKMMIHKQLYGEELPRSYTIDIGVDRNNVNYLIEIHNFISCGTYGFKGDDLLHMYIQGINFERDRQRR